MKYFAHVTSAALILACSSLTASAAAFSNGGFETGVPTGGVPLNAPDNSTIPSWSIGGTTQTIEFNNSGDNGQNAQAGSHFISFGHNTTTGGTLSQTFDTVIGSVYTIDYFISRIQGGSAAGGSMSVTAFIGTTNVALNTVSNSIPEAARNNIWTAGATLTFTALSTSTTLQFLDTTPAGGGGDSNWALDTVTVNAQAPAAGVPETGSSIAFFAIGLAGMFAARRVVRRRALR